jgi:transposase
MLAEERIHPVAIDPETTLVAVVELSGSSWMIAGQIPGVDRMPKRNVEPSAAAVRTTLEAWTRRAMAKGRMVRRTVLAYEIGRDGFWLARLLRAEGIEVHIIQPASVAVDRRARRAKTDAIDLDLLMRTLLAWLRGEPRVCSMVPVPSVEDEDARRPGRERQDLLKVRLAIENRIGSLLMTLGIRGYAPARRDRWERLESLRTPQGALLPPHAKAQIKRGLTQLELVLGQIAELEAQRDAVLDKPAADNKADAMIQALCQLRAVGPETATLLVREAFSRPIRGPKALGSYAGLTGSPWASGGMAREQGISKAGNALLRKTLVQLAWVWLRFQPDSTLARWFTERTAGANKRMRKIMAVALARKLLLALWRFAKDGVLPEGAVLKAAA